MVTAGLKHEIPTDSYSNAFSRKACECSISDSLIFKSINCMSVDKVESRIVHWVPRFATQYVGKLITSEGDPLL